MSYNWEKEPLPVDPPAGLKIRTPRLLEGDFEVSYAPEKLIEDLPEQEISFWVPYYLFPNGKQSYVLHSKCKGRIYLSKFEPSNLVQGEEPTCEMSIQITGEK